jgi:hypothetical protein
MSSQPTPLPNSGKVVAIPAKKSLIKKIAEACNAVGGVEKKGRNDFQNYDYVRAADVAKAIRRELFSRGVVIVQNEKNFRQIGTVLTNKGNELREWQLDVDFLIFDADSDDSLTVQAFGVAMDSGDKAIYKCKTGATKYFLRALGLIPDERDDPEFDSKVDEAVTRSPKKPAQRQPADNAHSRIPRIKEFQARAWEAACRETGKTAKQVADYLRIRWSANTIMELNVEDFPDAVKWATATSELTDDLKMSVKNAKAGKRGPQPIVPELDRYDAGEIAGD